MANSDDDSTLFSSETSIGPNLVADEPSDASSLSHENPNEPTAPAEMELADVSPRLSANANLTGLVIPASATTAELFQLASTIEAALPRWRDIEMVVACPLTRPIAEMFFPDKRIVILHRHADIAEFFFGDTLVAAGGIAVVSPWLISEILDIPVFAVGLARICKRRAIIVAQVTEPESDIRLRRALHAAGFYEIALPARTSKDELLYDDSTVGIFPDGSFDVRASRPGLRSDRDKFRTYVLGRTALMQDKILPWFSTPGLNYPRAASWRSSAPPDDFAFAMHDVVRSAPLGRSRIQAVGSWTAFGSGHAGLISCYQGPGDQNMYAAILDLVSETEVSVSLWRNDGEWQKLATKKVVAKNRAKEFFLDFAMTVDEKLVQIDVFDATELTIEDDKLARTSVAGIRIFGATIALSLVRIGEA